MPANGFRLEDAASRRAETVARIEKAGAKYSGTKRVSAIYATVRIHGVCISHFTDLRKPTFSVFLTSLSNSCEFRFKKGVTIECLCICL